MCMFIHMTREGRKIFQHIQEKVSKNLKEKYTDIHLRENICCVETVKSINREFCITT